MVNPSTDSPLSAEERAEALLGAMIVAQRHYGRLGKVPVEFVARLLDGLAAHPESRSDPGEGTFWLIERGHSLNHRPTVYWIDGDRWTEDWSKAQRFLSRDYAQTVIESRNPPAALMHRRGPWAVAAEHGYIASPVPTDRPEPIDEGRLARALITLRGDYPGVQFDAEAIAAAYRTEPGETTP